MKKAISISVIILFVIVNCSQSLAQERSENLNQLMTELSMAKEDSVKIRLLDTIAYKFYWEYEYDSCYHYADKALKISEKLCRSAKAKNNIESQKACMEYKAISLANLARGLKRYDKQAAVDTLFKALELIKQTGNRLEEGRMYESIGVIYEFTGKEAESLDIHLQALEAYQDVLDLNRIALQLTNVAVAYRALGNYGDALEYLVESLNISRDMNDSTGMVESLLAMGFTYLLVNKWDDALKAQNDALKIIESLNDSLGIARVYNDMGVTNMSAEKYDVALEQHKKALAIRKKSTENYYTYASYSYIGDIHEIKGNYTEAIENYTAALAIVKRLGIKMSEIYSYQNLGSVYRRIGNMKEAMKQFQLAFSLSQKVGDRTFETLALLSIAEIYLEWGQAEKALDCLQKAEKTAPKSNISYLTRIYRNLSEVYSRLGNFKNAYLNSMKYSQYKDSAVIAENLEKITSLTNRLEFENKKKLQDENHKKMMEIKQKEIARQKVVRNFSLFGAFVILILAIIYFIRFAEKNKLNNALNKTLSNLKSTQVQLVHAEKMASLGELTAGIAHEIQNPLNFVKNFSEVNTDLINDLNEEISNGNLEEIKVLAADIAINSEKITEHSKRAGSIVKGMLQHSRLGGNEKELTNLNRLADEYLRLAYHGLKAKEKDFNANFTTELDPAMPKIKVLPQEIGRVLLNLVNNAFHAVAEKSNFEDGNYKPLVSIESKWVNDMAIIKVKDNGNGIPDKVKDKIFQPFFTTKSKGEGTGLGLSLSYDIITKGHGGELNVETTEGEGTSFIISLPIK